MARRHLEKFISIVQHRMPMIKQYALISMYGFSDADMHKESYNTLLACAYQGDASLQVIEVSSNLSMVSMQLLPWQPEDKEDLWFIVEKSGLDDTEPSGYFNQSFSDWTLHLLGCMVVLSFTTLKFLIDMHYCTGSDGYHFYFTKKTNFSEDISKSK